MDIWAKSKGFVKPFRQVSHLWHPTSHSEYHELVGQIDATQQSKHKQDLQKELERLVIRMEEKGTQITKLRKHQQMVGILSVFISRCNSDADGKQVLYL